MKVEEKWSEEDGHQIIITLREETLVLPGVLALSCKEAYKLAEEILEFSSCGSTADDDKNKYLTPPTKTIVW